RRLSLREYLREKTIVHHNWNKLVRFSETIRPNDLGQRRPVMKTSIRSFVFPVLLFSIIALGPGSSWAQGNNPGIISPADKFHGLSYGEWEVKWWQAAFAIPVVGGDHPLFSGGIFGDEKGVRFLSGVGGNPTIEIGIPAGTALFFPIINFECSNIEAPPFFGAT